MADSSSKVLNFVVIPLILLSGIVVILDNKPSPSYSRPSPTVVALRSPSQTPTAAPPPPAAEDRDHTPPVTPLAHSSPSPSAYYFNTMIAKVQKSNYRYRVPYNHVSSYEVVQNNIFFSFLIFVSTNLAKTTGRITAIVHVLVEDE